MNEHVKKMVNALTENNVVAAMAVYDNVRCEINQPIAKDMLDAAMKIVADMRQAEIQKRIEELKKFEEAAERIDTLIEKLVA